MVDGFRGRDDSFNDHPRTYFRRFHQVDVGRVHYLYTATTRLHQCNIIKCQRQKQIKRRHSPRILAHHPSAMVISIPMRPLKRSERQFFVVVERGQNQRLFDRSSQSGERDQVGGFQRLLVLVHALHDEKGMEAGRIARVHEKIAGELYAIRHVQSQRPKVFESGVFEFFLGGGRRAPRDGLEARQRWRSGRRSRTRLGGRC